MRSLPNEFPSGSKEDKKGPPLGGPFGCASCRIRCAPPLGNGISWIGQRKKSKRSYRLANRPVSVRINRISGQSKPRPAGARAVSTEVRDSHRAAPRKGRTVCAGEQGVGRSRRVHKQSGTVGSPFRLRTMALASGPKASRSRRRELSLPAAGTPPEVRGLRKFPECAT